ncbi:MAG: PilC/PilY family type IV pilus protein [Gallionella sp.]|jgi:hypothetical protein
MSKFPQRLQKPQIFGLFTLLGIAIAVVKLSLAISTFVPANQPIGYVAQDEVTNYILTSGNETLFRTEYKRDYWGGNLYAYPVDAVGNVQTGTDSWGGGTSVHIGAQNWDTGRFIATLNATGVAVPFRAASLSGPETTAGTQQASLKATINTTAYTSTQIVNFLRGDRSNEGPTGMRPRSSVLGDIIHSRPYYVSDTTNPTVFVGSNDGMLHAINTATGQERWAYVPSMLIGKLKTLAYNPNDAALTYAHDYFIDGQINIAAIASGAKRVLVGGLGGGGKGLFALDITGSTGLAATSDADVAGKILWEITPSKVSFGGGTTATTDYARLGYSYGTPSIVKINNGGTPMDVVIIGNGYDDAGTGESYLYVINAATGGLVKAIQAGTTGAANANGLSNPAALDTNGDGYVDRVYAGDLNGTMWKFNLSSSTVSNWSSSALLVTSPAQSITTTPGVALHPNGGYMVSFGTGRVFTGSYGTYNPTTSTWTTASTGDLADTSVNYVYGVWDGAPVANTAALTQTLTERSYTTAGATTRVRRSTANQPNWASGGTKYWKVALPAGERVIGEGSFTENGRFYFIGYNPTIAPYRVPGTTTDVFGENWLMELNYLTGGSSTTPFLDMDSNLLLNDADRITYITGDTLPAGKAVGDPILSPSEDGIPVGKWLSRGVQSQPILVQLQTLNTTLFNQNPDVIFPPSTTVSRGVAGGHFDVDNFYGTNNNCTGLGGAGTQAQGYIDFTYSNDKNLSNFSITIGGVSVLDSNDPPSKSRGGLEDWVAQHFVSADYTAKSTNSKVRITKSVAGVATPAIVVSATGLSSSDYTITAFSGGADPAASLYSASGTNCDYVTHHHEYDDEFDKTGVNMLNASDAKYNLSRAITSAATGFKVLMMNQYLSPAVSLHIGNSSYNPSSSAGYVSVKNYQASSGFDVTTAPSYNMNTIGSLAINMPVDAFAIKDWWGTGDARVGLHSVSPQCTWSDSGVGADMYQPVTPPANGTDGPGTTGTTTGARHNGVLTVQIIKGTTPASAVEENVSGRPEYGYRVKHANFYDYVLVEYIFYWHHPRNVCYDTAGTAWKQTNNNGDAWNTVTLMTGSGWTKAPPEDNAVSTANSTPATGSTDPKLGVLGSTGTVSSSSTSVAGNVTTTTINYTDGTRQTIVQTANSDGTVTITTTMYAADNTVTSTTTSVVANAAGSVKTGGDERGLQARTGRVSWHELIRN